MTHQKTLPLYILAGVICLGFFAMCGMLMFQAIPEGQANAVMILFGALAGAFGSVVGYFFGSSASSAAKTEIIAAEGKKNGQ